MEKEKQYIYAYVSEPYLINNEWKAYVSEFMPSAGKYFKIKIEVPEEYTERYLGEVEAEIMN